MPRQELNIGTTANDGTGDTLRAAGRKINENFTEIYGNLRASTELSDSGVTFNGTDSFQTLLVASPTRSEVTISIPDSDGTLIINRTAQTLTDKTLTAPIITSPKISPHIEDSNGAEIIEFDRVQTAVNHVKISHAAAGSGPKIESVGGDTNIPLRLKAKGSGVIEVQSRIRYTSQNISSAGTAINLTQPLTRFTGTGTLTSTLVDGGAVGESKTLINLRTGNCTVTPATFVNGTTLHLKPKSQVELTWVGTADGGWLLNEGKIYDSSDALGRFFVK